MIKYRKARRQLKRMGSDDRIDITKGILKKEGRT
jgi:hypothetical protein